MNATEKILAERMEFVTRRGRTAEYQRNEWLKKMRAERKLKLQRWFVASEYESAQVYGSLLFAKRMARAMALNGECSATVKDGICMIVVYETEVR